MFRGKKRFYALALTCIILIAVIGSVFYFLCSDKFRIDYTGLMEAWDYVGAQIVEFPFGKLVKEHPTSNVCWLNDAWLVSMALAKLYPDVSSSIMKALDYFNFTDERWCVIFGDVKNFAGPFGMKKEEYGEYNGFEIKAWVSDREQFMPDFANYSDLLALSVMFERNAGHDWKAEKLYDSLRGMWTGIGFVDKIFEEEEHFDTYKLALACIAAQLMDDYQFADKLADAIMKNQYISTDDFLTSHQWGFITWYKRLGEPLNPDIPTNMETTTLCLIALSPFMISQPVYGLPIKVGAFYYVWYGGTKNYNFESNIKVGIYYYTWYTGIPENHTNVIDTPLLGLYNSQDTRVIKKHLEWFNELDVDFLIVSWWGINTFTDNATKILFDTVKQEKANIQLVVFVEPFNESGIYNYTTIYNYIEDTFVSPYPNIYMRLHGRPLLCFFNAESLTKNGGIPFDDRFEIRIVGHRSYVHWVYCSVNASRWGEHWGWLEQPLCFDGQMNVLPRFDDRACKDRKNHTVIDPDYSGGLYDEQWSRAINLAKEGKVNFVTITSWNEFAERTQIEPCYDNTSYKQDPYLMFNKTKEYIKLIKPPHRHWNDSVYNTVVDKPVLGYYSSQEESIILQHLEWFKELGIDFLIVSWWGMNTYEDNSTKKLFDAIKNYKYDIEVVIMVEPENKTSPKNPWNETYNYIYNSYVSKYPDTYMKLNDKPLLCHFNPLKPPGDNRFEDRIVGQNGSEDWHFWNQTQPRISADGFVSIIPKYDDYYLSKEFAGQEGRASYQRYDADLTEGLYDRQWIFVINNIQNIKLIAINSWNEYHERTQIEPHINMNGNYILSLYCKTKYYMNQISAYSLVLRAQRYSGEFDLGDVVQRVGFESSPP